MRFLLLFLLSPIAFADPTATVWARYPDTVREFFPPDQYKMLDAAAENKENHDSGYLPPDERAALFHKLKLEDAVQGLDEMDKDMLVMGARFDELPALKKHYPMLSEDQLRGLKREVAGASSR